MQRLQLDSDVTSGVETLASAFQGTKSWQVAYMWLPKSSSMRAGTPSLLFTRVCRREASAAANWRLKVSSPCKRRDSDCAVVPSAHLCGNVLSKNVLLSFNRHLPAHTAVTHLAEANCLNEHLLLLQHLASSTIFLSAQPDMGSESLQSARV